MSDFDSSPRRHRLRKLIPDAVIDAGKGLLGIFALFAVMAGVLSLYWGMPDGPIAEMTDHRPPTRASRICLALTQSGACYLFGTKQPEPTPYNVTYRAARIRVLGQKYGLGKNFKFSGGPKLSEEEDAAGYEYWLGHAPDELFDEVMRQMDIRLKQRAGSDAPAPNRLLKGLTSD